jgi:chloramphenicol-sensitive protein RarD
MILMKKGVLSGAAAYALWGFFPIYFKALHIVPPLQIMTHRMVWCFLFLIIVIAVRKELPAFKAIVSLKTLLIYLGSALLLSVNWLTYVWAVNAGYVLEASLGYFINPLVSVLLGVIFFGEKLRSAQWVALGLATVGVLYLTFSYGGLVWISLVLAFSFGFYGMIKKIAPLGSLQGLTLETATLFLPALGFLLFSNFNGSGMFVHAGGTISLLLALTGVITAIPLLLFSVAARSVSLTTLGLLQYVSPTLQFFCGVVLFGEAFTPTRVIGFSIIWLALILFSAESYLVRRKTALSAGF